MLNPNNNGSGGKPRLRAPAFSDKEDEALIKAYSKNQHLIRGRNSMGVTQRTRNDAWEAVTKAVNEADGRCERTVKSVKIHYGNMFAEYKGYKSNDRTSRNSHQNPQPFFKYFDELLGEKGADLVDNSEEYSVDGSEDFTKNSHLLTALCAGNGENLSSLAACFANGDKNGSLNAFINTLGGGDGTQNGNNQNGTPSSFLQSAAYLAGMKMELTNPTLTSGESSAANARTTNTPPANQLNGGGLSANNLAMFLSGSLMNGGNNPNGGEAGPSANGGQVQPATRKRRGSNAPTAAAQLARESSAARSTPQNEPPAVEADPVKNASASIHQSVQKRRASFLNNRVMRRKLEMLDLEEEILRKRSRLLDLEIALQERRMNMTLAEGGVPVGASDSLDTSSAFVMQPVTITETRDSFGSLAVSENGGPPPFGDNLSTQTESNASPQRKVARVAAVNAASVAVVNGNDVTATTSNQQNLNGENEGNAAGQEHGYEEMAEGDDNDEVSDLSSVNTGAHTSGNGSVFSSF